MTNSKHNPISLIFIFLAAFFIVLLVAPVWADNPHHNDDGGDTDVSLDSVVNNVIRGGSTHTFSLSGSDADINQCRYTVGAVTAQWTRNNPWCEAMDLIRMGFVDAGVLKFCTMTSVGESYPNLRACQAGMIRTVKAKPEPVVIEPDDDEDDDRYEQLAQQLAAVQVEQQQVQQQMQQRPTVRREIIPYLSEDKKAKLREAIK